MPAGPLEPTCRYDLTAMQRLETAWRPPWLICRMAQQGHRHYRLGAPSDDNHIVGGAGDATWLALGDGIGSEPRSRFGSAAACFAVDQHLGRRLAAGEEPSQAMLVDAMDAAHVAIVKLAKRERRPPGEYGSTLCAAVLKGDRILTATLGDSSIAISSRHDTYDGQPADFVMTPFCTSSQAPAAGSTFSIHDPHWKDCIATNETANPAVTGLFLASDGGHNFFLDEIHAGHEFDPAYPQELIAQLEAKGPLQLALTFGIFLRDVRAENDDDRTLLMAYRAPENLFPSAKAA